MSLEKTYRTVCACYGACMTRVPAANFDNRCFLAPCLRPFASTTGERLIAALPAAALASLRFAHNGQKGYAL